MGSILKYLRQKSCSHCKKEGVVLLHNKFGRLCEDCEKMMTDRINIINCDRCNARVNKTDVYRNRCTSNGICKSCNVKYLKWVKLHCTDMVRDFERRINKLEMRDVEMVSMEPSVI